MNNENAWRFTIIGSIVSLLAGIVLIQLFRIQLNPKEVEHFLEQSKIYEGDWRPVYPIRGRIYDRYGHEMAGNTTVYEVGIQLNQVNNPHTIALTLNVLLGLDYAEINEIASREPSDKLIYAVVANNVTKEQIERLEKYKEEISRVYGGTRGEDTPSLAGLEYTPRLARSYPEQEIGAGILGFVNQEGEGFYGVEAWYDDLLSGDPQWVFIPRDPNRAEDLPNIPDGASLVLTIDRNIQANVEQILDDAVDSNGATSGTIVVIDPQTGEILAAATTPRMDLNKYSDYSKIFKGETPFNRVVSQAYEPGSVYKVLTMAAALDKGAVKPDTTFIDTGVIEVGGAYIYNWNSGAWGPQDMQGCLQHSLNVCLAWVATQLGAKDFYSYMRAFSIGHLTGVDMAGENPGRLKIPGDADWYDADLGTNAFGQGVSATPLQMATAISAVANEGKMMAPHIVRSIIDNGEQYNNEPRVLGIPIKKETAQTLTEMLSRSLEEEASDALVEGYRIAGKTGTAEIPTPYGYSSSATNASFVGWGPLDDPQFLVYVWLEKPTSSPWGSIVASPVFRQVVERLVVLMDIPPDRIRKALTANH